MSSRSNAAAWGCHVHNEVNKSLGKEVFDCSKIGDFYDCGCAEDGDEGPAEGTAAAELGDKPEGGAEKGKLGGSDESDADGGVSSGKQTLQLEKEG